MLKLLTAAVFMLAMCPTLAGAQYPEPPDTATDKFREDLDIGISTNEIAISSDFTGADITVFGAIDDVDEFLLAIGSYDIIVALEGPNRVSTVRRKERVAGIWVNRHSIRFEPSPTSYSVSSTRPLQTITSPMELSSRNIGFANIRLMPTGHIGDGSRLNDFREALRRIKQKRGLYQSESSGVKFISKSLFRASVRLPASIPIGTHTVRAILFRDGEFVDQKEVSLRVVKTGLEQFTYELAHEHAFFYGLLSVAIALVTGWLGSVLFRKD